MQDKVENEKQKQNLEEEKWLWAADITVYLYRGSAVVVSINNKKYKMGGMKKCGVAGVLTVSRRNSPVDGWMASRE